MAFAGKVAQDMAGEIDWTVLTESESAELNKTLRSSWDELIKWPSLPEGAAMLYENQIIRTEVRNYWNAGIFAK
jgi:hypothetical protein